jgi:TRAP-type C4-dicarboxylate transport system permease small subunit
LAEILRKIDRAVHKILLVIAQVSLIAMVLILTYTVILRYVFNTGLSWAEEVPRLLVTVFVFLACAMGVRDHLHISVNVVYNRFKKDGRMRKALEVLGDVAVLACGLFMFVIGGQRVLKMMSLSGVQPMTGLPNWVQYISVPIAGFIMVYDSILFLTGVIKPGDLLFSEREIDYADRFLQEKREQEKEGPQT